LPVLLIQTGIDTWPFSSIISQFPALLQTCKVRVRCAPYVLIPGTMLRDNILDYFRWRYATWIAWTKTRADVQHQCSIAIPWLKFKTQ